MRTNYFIKAVLALTLMGSITLNVKGQDRGLRYDPVYFIGTWVATEGDMTYELTIQKEIMSFEESPDKLEILSGSLVYKRNREIIRQTKMIGSRPNPRIIGGLESPKHANLSFRDTERKAAGKIRMIIDPKNDKKATWKITKTGSSLDPAWNKSTFDIPTELEWTKIE